MVPGLTTGHLCPAQGLLGETPPPSQGALPVGRVPSQPLPGGLIQADAFGCPETSLVKREDGVRTSPCPHDVQEQALPAITNVSFWN